ncbi:hypothetical protein [Actinomadura sp. 9N215]|uniref:hypothetical protein n=1 Tax=Actinomadura sp. 9N215 TaxID=3375150 RepID=UPI00379645E5
MTSVATERIGEHDPPAERIMHDLTDPSADVRWTPGDAEKVDQARKAFAAHMSSGAIAYRADDPQSGGEQIREFDPEAAVIVITRPLQGG